jgi:hypothetical protein
MNANLISTTDTDYKNGFVLCVSCGWKKELGDGFNQYKIDACPACNPLISTRVQNTVTVGRRGNYEVRHGHYVYFVITNGINVQYSGITSYVEHKSRV